VLPEHKGERKTVMCEYAKENEQSTKEMVLKTLDCGKERGEGGAFQYVRKRR
jgi:hypothetical protein